LKAGASFRDLAVGYSEDPESAPRGGDLGLIPVSQLRQAPPPLRDAVLGKEAGAVNVATSNGAYALMLVVAHEHLSDRRLADRGIPSRAGKPVDVAPSHFFGSISQSVARGGVDTGTATIEHRFSRNLSFRNHFLAGRYDKFYQNVYAGSDVSAAGTLTLAAYNHSNDRVNTFNQSDFIYTGELGGMDHTILFGAEVGHQFQDETRYTAANISNVPVGNSLRDADFANAVLAVDRRAASNVLAGYVQDQVALTRRWKAVIGARTDRFAVKIRERRAGAAKRILFRLGQRRRVEVDRRRTRVDSGF